MEGNLTMGQIAKLSVRRSSLGYTSEYQAWNGMKKRCYNENSKDYPYYGGRGIKVCAKWKTDFYAFRDDVGFKPSSEYTLDRIDSNGNYEPNNVRWSTRAVQARNQRRIKPFTANGKTMLLVDWSEHLGIPYGILLGRLRRGRSPDESLTRNYVARHRRAAPGTTDCAVKANGMYFITVEGLTLSISEWATQVGISPHTLRSRIVRGMHPFVAVFMPSRNT